MMKTRFNQHYVDLLWAMTWREFSVRYKKAVFGFLWILINPLLQMIIMGMVFSNFVKIPNYFIFIFSGLLAWQFFSLSIAKVTPIFINEKHLIFKSKFPREIIPISIVLSNFMHYLIANGLFMMYLAFSGFLVPSSVLQLTIAVGWILVLAIGVGLLTSTLNVRFRDVNFFVQASLILWFYATPILYSLSIIPPTLLVALRINPLSTPIALIHSAILKHSIPDIALVMSNAAITVFLIIIGIIVFSKESANFTDNL